MSVVDIQDETDAIHPERPTSLHPTDAYIGLVTGRAIPNGKILVGALVRDTCGVGTPPFYARDFSGIARAYVLERLPVLGQLNDETLDEKLDLAHNPHPLSDSESKYMQIVREWLEEEKKRLNLGASLSVPPITEADGEHYENLTRAKMRVRDAANAAVLKTDKKLST